MFSLRMRRGSLLGNAQQFLPFLLLALAVVAATFMGIFDVNTKVEPDWGFLSIAIIGVVAIFIMAKSGQLKVPRLR